MIITNKALARRTFLRGVGATMALPVLDAMFSPLTAVAQTMKKAPVRLGYVYTPESEADDPGRRVFRKGPDDMKLPRTHHLHVTDPDSDYWHRIIAFRDHLRDDPDDAAAYGELKRTLARAFEHDSRGFTDAKHDFVRTIECKARGDR